MTDLKPCRRCGGAKERGENRQLCNACRSLSKWKRNRHSQHRNLVYRLRKLYGMTEAEHEALVVFQAGRCAICWRPPDAGQRLDIDHNHDSGRIRGLLCRLCNRMLGCGRDDIDTLRAAVAYLEVNR